MKIIKATILVGRTGPDQVFLLTDLPCPYVPASGLTDPASFRLDCSANAGEEYVKKNFPDIPVEIIDL